MSTEQACRAARQLSEGAEVARRAADSLSECTQRLAHMFEPGYGNLADQLIELLQTRVTVEELVKQRDSLLRIAKRIQENDTRLGMQLAIELAQVVSDVEAKL